MVKGTKKQSGKPITAFFSKATKPLASSPSVPSSSQGTTSSVKDAAAIKPRNDKSTRIKSNVETTGQSLKSDSTEGSVPASIASFGGFETSPSPRPDAGASSLKRARSPEAHLFSTTSTPRKPQTPKSTGTKKGKLGIDSDIDDIDSAGYVKSPNPQRKKKTRVSSPEALNGTQSIHFVPSSQSDEEPPVKKLETHAAVSIAKDSPTTDDAWMDMDADEDKVTPLESTSGSWSLSNQTSSRQDEDSLNIFLISPSSDLPSMPPTPVALDAASKTAKIIADIKARAFAKSLSSPESAPLEFNDQLESSSDEEDILPVFPIVKKSVPSVKPATSNPVEPSARYPLRNRASVSPTRASSSRATTSKIAIDKSPPRTSNLAAKSRTKAVDPFAALLKEKKSTAKRGNGTDAFRLAEITASNVDRDDLFDDTDLDDEGDQADWKAATQAARNANWLVDKALTPGTSRSSSSKINLEEGDKKRLFGQAGGKTILDILERDKASEEEAGNSAKVSGIHLWSKAVANSVMQVDEDVSLPQIPGQSPIIHLLNAFLKRSDLRRAAALLNMPIMMSIDVSERAMVASSLCSLLSSSSLDMLAGQATHVLETFWGSKMEPVASRISFSHVLDVCYQMGIEASLLASQNWPSPISEQFKNVNPSHEVKVVRNLIVLITACAKSGRLKAEEIPDILLSVLLFGMDSEASSEVLQDITLAVHQICQCIPRNDLEFETRLLSRLVGCVRAFEPVNKLRFLSFLSNGAGHTRRIASLLAHCIITDKSPSQDMLLELPSLRDITEQLASYSKSSGMPPGKFALHEETDYIDLGFYVSILAVAVSNIKEYVVQERQASKSKQLSASHQASPSKSSEKPKADLQVLHVALETLHSNIADTRATHLERSRTKAIIKGLAMNIYYQREFWLKNDTGARAKTLAQYFKKKDKL